ncbi:hypothetical protein Drose_27020 [Dactylosporangium roseum]|uniref:Hydroxyacid dehydrogenase n=1 Tax=Dactylosporangium roseum TaxID=47989 RepID=A0ABY5YYJ4_9ACTN|nr:four-carbon acid sugar kinase family protein [Dactylosporangium roseum]UWZ34821.1 hypothetical protein Drose_27020 [Dactylosporangium roseum]
MVTESPGRRLADLDQPTPTHEEGVAAPIIAEANRSRRMWTVVLDDDPTGTQTVRGAPVVLPGAPDAELAWAAQHPGGITFVLTNTRAVDADQAERTTYQLVRRAARLADGAGHRLRVVTRGDSTLRGHFRTELLAAGRALADAGQPIDGVLFVPCFLEAGRYTAADVQWVDQDGLLSPAAHTEFARDATFGYEETGLLPWTRARWPVGPHVGSLSLEAIRDRDGVARIAKILCGMAHDDIVVANAVRAGDLEVLMLALLAAEQAGRRILVRSGPSMVRLLAGQPSPEPLTPPEVAAMRRPGGRRGLVVAGSHTALTNAQVAAARAAHDPALVELDASAVVGDGGRHANAEVRRCAEATSAALARDDVILRTSRDIVHSGQHSPLLVSRKIAQALSNVVSLVVRRTPPAYVIAKGGITSSDIAAGALGSRRALVAGQMFPGQVPVWDLRDGLVPGLPLVVFPGNVGHDRTLAEAMERFRDAGSDPGSVQDEGGPA